MQQEGDFAGSLIWPLHDDKLLHQPAIASFAISLAVGEMLQSIGIAADKITLKWPNDVLLEGGKVCGLLLETAGDTSRKSLIIGIGINIVSAPEIDAYRTAKIMGTVAEDNVPRPEELLAPLDAVFTNWLERTQTEGFAPLREEWKTRLKGLGEPIIVRLPDRELTGVFEGIAEDGALLLRQEEQLRSITAGDVFFPSALV